MKRNGNKEPENTLFLQLKKDMKKRNKRVYIPVAVFQHPENIEIKCHKEPVARLKFTAFFGSIIE